MSAFERREWHHWSPLPLPLNAYMRADVFNDVEDGLHDHAWVIARDIVSGLRANELTCVRRQSHEIRLKLQLPSVGLLDRQVVGKLRECGKAATVRDNGQR